MFKYLLYESTSRNVSASVVNFITLTLSLLVSRVRYEIFMIQRRSGIFHI